ncbi:MAG: RimK family alpha-L-glutamate ligase [Candidatus Diapherotrites archaeon]|nr:RimK family alpha-L-glutamate ligase [Candidatus Diapherotrites archaeon]
MKLLILTGRKSKEEAIKHFIEAAKEKFDSVLSVSLDKIRIECIEGKTKLMFKSTDLTSFDVCLPRFFSNDFAFADIILDILDASNVFVPANAESYQITNNKYYTVKILSNAGIKVPISSLSLSEEPTLRMGKQVGYPCVVKLLSGFGGKGVMLAKDETELTPLLDTLKLFKEFISTQEFFANQAKDLRCLVVGEKVIGIERIAKEGEWRSNVSKGGEANVIDLSDEAKEISIESAKILGLNICAVDLMKNKKNEYVVVEVNFTPGTMIKYFDKELAKKFVEFIYEKGKEYKK